MLSKYTISPSEFKVMEILWSRAPLSASQIIQELEDVETWHSRTIKSLINRLLKKNIIGYTQEGSKYLYYPLLKKNDYLKTTSRNFIDRVFGGRVSPLVAYFAQHEKLSKEDIQELKAILNEFESNE